MSIEQWIALAKKSWYKDSHAKSLFLHVFIKLNQDQVNAYQTTTKALSKETGMTIGQVRGALKKLQNSGDLTISSTNRFSLISLVNIKVVEAFKTQANKRSNKQELSHFDSLHNDEMWLEHVARLYKTSTEKVQQKLIDFNQYLLAINDHKNNLNEYRQHFINWLKMNSQDLKAQGAYTWKWKGQNEKRGTYQEMMKDKKIFDQPGFGFKMLTHGN